MDDNQNNSLIDPAAQRKRRSSILKSQRPPRTPFAELEFKVATPTDTSKSRRVSFSKRTDVAEFITNEATTTWKNFYEEHNKSLETSSGNDALSNAQRPQSIGQLGRDIFDQQFEEVEAIDFGERILPAQSLAHELQNSFNNGNFTQQLAAIECNGEKLTLRHQTLELSELTDQKSRLFNDELTVPAVAEMSNLMNIDFSIMQSKCDDLDEIQKDLNRVHQNVVGPASYGGNVSQYIEVDLNVTGVGLNDDDMSITETVHSPLVQAVIKTASKKSVTDLNLEDKESIALNPYAPICEAANFAIEEENEVLVFDGKKLTTGKNIIEAPKSTNVGPTKTIVLNTNDDLPNFISDPKVSLKLSGEDFRLSKESLSIKQGITNDIFRRTTLYDDNISMTQALPVNVIEEKRIIINNDFDMSTTQAFSTNIIDQDIKQSKPEERTTVYDNDCNISMTQALPTNIVNTLDKRQSSKTEEKRKTIVNENGADISTTQSVSTHLLLAHHDNIETAPRQSMIFFEDGDISMTQAIPAMIFERNNEPKTDISLTQTESDIQNKTQHYQNMDISFTRVLPQNILQSKRRTICNEVDVSITQAIPSNILETEKTVSNYNMDASITQTIPQSVFIARIENQRPLSHEVSMNQKDLQILPIIEGALVRECQATKLNILEAHLKNDIPSIITDNRSTEKESNYNMDTSNVIHPPHLNMSADQNKSMNESNSKPKYGNLSTNKSIPSNILTSQENLENENKQIKSDNYHEFISEKQSLVYQSTEIIKIRKCDQVEKEQSLQDITIEMPSKMSVKENKSISLNNDIYVIDLSRAPTGVNALMNTEENQEIKESQSNLSEKPISMTVSNASQSSTKTKKTILSELLDMSTGSEECFNDKNVMAVVESKSSKEIKTAEENIAKITSSDVFKITRGSYEELDFDELKSKTNKTPAIMYKEEESRVDDLNDKLHTLQSVAKNRYYEHVVSEDMKEPDMKESCIHTRKSFKNADDTRELLQMLSEFTDRPPTINEEDINLKEEEKYGETQTEPRRINFTANRRSIVLSQDELRNNISMARAALQQSQYMDETYDEASEISNDTLEISDIDDRKPRSLIISGDVVKSLKFDDMDVNDDIVISPLKKTAFGETTYMKESTEKAKVIPTYDVTDGIKELMTDLVKPMADVLPFESGNLDRSTKKSPSTTSTQIQANLITSSQIDIDVKLHSNPESEIDMNTSLLNKVASFGSKALASVLPGPKIDEIPAIEPKSPRNRPSVPGGVIVFDPSNPLNNVVLSPREYENVHSYNPLRSSDTLHSERERSVQFSDSNHDKERVETHLNVTIASGDAGQIKTAKSNTSIKSKPLSIDRSVEFRLNMKETEINTDIAMKPNAELLEAHSSLTLVDDALARSTFDVDLDTRPQSEMDENGRLSEKLESDLNSNDGDIETAHTKKRSRSPCILRTDLTPKPQSKIQKMSKSPQKKLTKTRHSPRKSITVQEIMTEFNITKTDQNEIVKQVNEAVDFEMRSATSYVSTESGQSELPASGSSAVDWRNVSEQSSKNLFDDCESSTNVVAKIDMLPFMGSRDCEWEVTSGDTWSFLLLRSRLRITIRRAHTYLNSSRSCVRADTPVLAANVDLVNADERDPLIALALRLASETMRYECLRQCTTAGDIPAVLKRCVTVSRTTVQWLRVMRNAMLRLAFQVDTDGYLTLKVANIPLRSVWDVSMKIELIVEDAHETAWPCAGSVGISTVVADVEVSADSLNRLVKNVPHDWGHAPRTIWKIFKYLKNKTRGDDFFGISVLDMIE